MAELIIKFTDTAEGLEIMAVSDPEKLDPFSAAHQFAFALQQNEDLLSDFIQTCIDSIKTIKEVNIIGSQETNQPKRLSDSSAV